MLLNCDVFHETCTFRPLEFSLSKKFHKIMNLGHVEETHIFLRHDGIEISPTTLIPPPLPENTKQVRIDHPAADDIGGDSSAVAVEIAVASEADGYAVLTYVLSVVDDDGGGGGGGSGGNSSSASGLEDDDQGEDGQGGLVAALNAALRGRTTDGCICVATQVEDDVGGDGGSYDCSACQDGGAFSTASSVSTPRGGYDLLSRSSGQPPISVFAAAESQGDDDMFWGSFAGGEVRC